MNADGSGSVHLFYWPARNNSMALSPGGTRIALFKAVGTNNHAFTMNLDGTGLTDVTPAGQDARPTDW